MKALAWAATLAVAAAILLHVPAQARSPVFTIEVVDSGPNDVGQHSSMTLDCAGRLVVAYYDATAGDLLYAVQDVIWSIALIDSLRDVGKYPSLAIDSLCRYNVAYYEATSGALKYSGWLPPLPITIETPPLGPHDVGQYASCGLDQFGHLNVAYYDATERTLWFARRVFLPSALWRSECIDPVPDVGKYVSLKMNRLSPPRGPGALCELGPFTAYIAYFDATSIGLKFACGVPAPATDASIPEGTDLPASWALSLPQPHPFRSRAMLWLDVPWAERVHATVFDVRGRLVRKLQDERFQPGRRALEWDARDDQGKPVVSGVYFLQVTAGSFVRKERLVLLR